ncbi:hypothetical protein VINI7043_03733 [Vibrio nigripulchritudo ATCC 27043]|uniref:Lipoprotein n=2 Tax=Vibrio nigripulchritudo TaxID=28173 RepID=U4KI73_9VIBR|nr:hypothetical protein [Vibrio nigripulchritudo]EGU54772.1 hypothetical protein VINI7043_03733 [Vibrio nigripulchritudo ATCC 27043]CCN36598.1 conserved hypothetical protein [Vibrio nigripulchritudo AM115]CCN40455.1 conserved hypothetical protein [Vibrio nigripulchritudo FTn2]CCN67553.1 conserved hypothetical protein [Vibrio nigripulchritudo POn4]CCN79062.1 conserved hypothetical protein [Vibrio nigripulchritudo SO65]
MTIKWNLGLGVLCTMLMSGCQLTQQGHQGRIYDPTKIDEYQLPILIENVPVVQSFRQTRVNETWFWTQLGNDTFLPGENLVVQVLGTRPLEQPPAMFGFNLPTENGAFSINSLGPYQSWVNETESGERCMHARQNARKDSLWISIFTRYCTSDKDKSLTWVSHFKPSLILEKY